MNQNFINILKSIHFVHICRFLKLKNLILDLSIFSVYGHGAYKFKVPIPDSKQYS